MLSLNDHTGRNNVPHDPARKAHPPAGNGKVGKMFRSGVVTDPLAREFVGWMLCAARTNAHVACEIEAFEHALHEHEGASHLNERLTYHKAADFLCEHFGEKVSPHTIREATKPRVPKQRRLRKYHGGGLRAYVRREDLLRWWNGIPNS